jgi:hypothetical protein
MKFNLTALFLVVSAIHAFAQLEKTMHQTFEVGEARQIVLDLYGEYEIKHWEGNNVMTETSVKIFNATPQVLNHLVNQQRYDIQPAATGEVLKLASSDMKRESIMTKHGDCSEYVVLIVYMPAQFQSTDNLIFTRKD